MKNGTQRFSIGKILSLCGTGILTVALLCNGFELVSATVYRIIGGIGIAVELAALVFILKRNAF